MDQIIDWMKNKVAQKLSYDKIQSIEYNSREINNIQDRLYTRSPLSIKLKKDLRNKPRIGMAILAHERPQFLDLCLDSLFKTNLYDYNITFLIQDDGSVNPAIRKIIEKERDPRYNIERSYSPKGHNSWGAAFNKAMRKLMEIDNFDIIGSCDSDAFFNTEWLDKTMQICLWAKKNHRDHILGPFSSFNSSDYKFHQILGTYSSPYGNYVVKRRMGALNYFYFKYDFLKLGFFDEHRDDETRMTKKFKSLRVRNFCTETSFIEHIGRISVLDQWRPTPVGRGIVYGMNLAKTHWPKEVEVIDTIGYYRYIKDNISLTPDVFSKMKIDIIIPAIEKDLLILSKVIDSAREFIRHPLGKIAIISPISQKIEDLCLKKNCNFIFEDSVLPITKKDIDYIVNGEDRSGWLFQQFLKMNGDRLAQESHYLVLDADTVLIRPQVFELNGKAVLLHSDEHHQPYFDIYEKLFGAKPCTDLSFVSHQMLIEKNKIIELKKELESGHYGKKWYEVIMNNINRLEGAAVSEYELYGQWMLRNYPDKIIREYWYNMALTDNNLKDLSYLQEKFGADYRSISFHSHLSGRK